jgi:hypothetical protein
MERRSFLGALGALAAAWFGVKRAAPMATSGNVARLVAPPANTYAVAPWRMYVRRVDGTEEHHPMGAWVDMNEGDVIAWERTEVPGAEQSLAFYPDA